MTPTPAPTSWAAFDPLRGCRLCSHGTTGARAAPAVTEIRKAPEPFATARALGGACGPEAKHLDFPGLRAR